MPVEGSVASGAGRRFLDTNVLLYALSADTRKADIAAAVLETGGIVSVQVLNEFVHVATGKLALPWAEVTYLRDSIVRLCAVCPLTLDMHRYASDLVRRYQLHFYDAMIVAAALDSGCDTLLTEDLHTGLVVDGSLAVSNPFV